MKSVVGISMVGAAAALSATTGNGLQMAIDMIKKLGQEYTNSLQEIAKTTAAAQEVCRHTQDTYRAQIREAESEQTKHALRQTRYRGMTIEAEKNHEQYRADKKEQDDQMDLEATSHTEEQAACDSYFAETESDIENLLRAKDHFTAVLSGKHSFIQLPKKVKSMIQAKARKGELDELDDLDFDDSNANANGMSGLAQVAQMVNDLYNTANEDFNKKRTECQQEKHNHALFLQNYQHESEQLVRNIAKEDSAKTASAASEAEATSELENAGRREKAVRDQLKVSLEDCSVEKETSEGRLAELRAAHIAVASAIDQLSGKVGVGFIQASSLLQIHRTLSTDDVRDRVSEELFSFAKRYSSPAISNIAMAVKASGLDKVKEMISGLIKTLEQQTRDMTSKHEQCTNDLDTKESQLKTAESKLESYNDQLAISVANIAESQQTVDDTTAAQAARHEAHVELDQTLSTQIADYKAEKDDVEATLAVVRDVLAQFEQALTNPAEQKSAEPVVAVLQTVESSCNDDKSNVEAALAKSKGLRDGEMKDFEKAKAVNEQTIVGATQAVTRAKQNKVGLEESIGTQEQQVKAQQDALQSLRTVCNGGSREDKHETQKAGREEEIKDLQRALEILQNQ